MNRKGGFHFNFVGFVTAAIVLVVAAAILFRNDGKNSSAPNPLQSTKEPNDALKVTDIPWEQDKTPTVPISISKTPSITPTVELLKPSENFISSMPNISIDDYISYMDPDSDYQKAIAPITVDGEKMRIRTAFMNATIFLTNDGEYKLVLSADEAETILKNGGKVFRIKDNPGAKDINDTFSDTRTSRIVLELIKRKLKVSAPPIRDYGNNGATILTGIASDWLNNDVKNLKTPFSGYPLMIKRVDSLTGKIMSDPLVVVIPRQGETIQESIERAVNDLGLNANEILFNVAANTNENLEKFALGKGLKVLK